MRYFGSKVSTIENVYDLIARKVPSGTICDPFGGVGIVGAYFKKRGYGVWCGDILTFAHYFQVARVEQNHPPTFKNLCGVLGFKSVNEVIDSLNNEKPKKGWFVKEYSEKRGFFTKNNAQHIEACRRRIIQWSKNGWLNNEERAVLLASLIDSIDKVANTAGTYYAHLKIWYRKAILPFQFKLLPYTQGEANCCSFLCEAKQLVALRFFDILYLDPPYNERCYAQYYHLPESIALEKTPITHGRSGIPDNRGVRSDFNKPGKARKALEELLKKAHFKVLAFHYADNGLITTEELRNIFSVYGNKEEFILDSKGYTTAKAPRQVKHRLYLISHG